MGTQKTISKKEIKPLSAEVADGSTSVQFKIDTARTAEVWIKITAKSGTVPTLDANIETRLNALTGWDVQKAFVQMTSEGSQAVVINRADHAFGTELRLSWSLGGVTPSFTFVVYAVRYE